MPLKQWCEEKWKLTGRVYAGQLKKNPVVSNDELNDIQSGLGDEAAKEFGKGGLGKGIGKAFG